MITNRIGQCPNSVIEHEQVLGLVALESSHEYRENISKVWYQLCTSFLFKCGKSATSSLLHTLVGIKNTTQQLRRERGERGE